MERFSPLGKIREWEEKEKKEGKERKRKREEKNVCWAPPGRKCTRAYLTSNPVAHTSKLHNCFSSQFLYHPSPLEVRLLRKRLKSRSRSGLSWEERSENTYIKNEPKGLQKPFKRKDSSISLHNLYCTCILCYLNKL